MPGRGGEGEEEHVDYGGEGGKGVGLDCSSDDFIEDGVGSTVLRLCGVEVVAHWRA